MAPGFRSRLAQPSSRLPMPGAKELSTVEWQRAQVMPTRVSASLPLTVSTVPLRPTTASSLSKATVVAGLARSTLPSLMPSHHGGRQRLGVDLQPDRQRCRGTDRGADDLMHPQRVGPTGFVAEGVEAEDLLALCDERGLLGGRAARACHTSATTATPPHATVSAAAAASATGVRQRDVIMRSSSRALGRMTPAADGESAACAPLDGAGDRPVPSAAGSPAAHSQRPRKASWRRMLR